MSKQNHNEEEIDLGSLFVIIGKGISRLINFLSSIFKSLFNFFIEILLFFRKNLLKISLGILTGALIGGILEMTLKTKYESELQVEPNFNSTRQLYENINYYNDLVKQKDTLLLTKTFKISTDDAKSIKKISIEPVFNEDDIIKKYDQLTRKVDTTTIKSYVYNNFKDAFSKYDYKIHSINVVSTKNNIFKQLTPTIINGVTENEYFKKIKLLTNENLERSNSLIKKNLIQADSLHTTYKKILLIEARKNNNGTTINTGNKENSKKELELFNTNRELNDELANISKQISTKSEVINIISDFQPIGHKINSEIKRNKTFLVAILGGFAVILFLLLSKLNNYLKSYKE